MLPGGSRQLLRLLHHWWTETNRDWLVSFMENRGILGSVKWVIAAVGMVLAASALVTNVVPEHGRPPWAGVVFSVSVVTGVIWAVRWLMLPWPSRRESLLLIFGIDTLLAACCFSHHDTMTTLASTVMFAALGCYVIFFESAKVYAAHALVVVASVVGALIMMARVDPSYAVSLGVPQAVSLLLVNIFIFPLGHIGFHLVREGWDDSVVDPLTGLANRRGMDEWVRALHRRDYRGRLALILLDLDRFKDVNDQYGHARGDHVLRSIGCGLADYVDGSALVARTGGEEFVVLIDGAIACDAHAYADELRKVVLKVTDPPVTASLGVAVIEGFRRPDDFGELMVNADSAMYRAKRDGGNRVS